jgi:hypothetical protein
VSVQDTLRGIGLEIMWPLGASWDLLLMLTFYSKFLELKWLEQIFADSIGTQHNSFALAGFNLDLSTPSLETTTTNRQEGKNHTNSDNSYWWLPSRVSRQDMLYWSNSTPFYFKRKARALSLDLLLSNSIVMRKLIENKQSKLNFWLESKFWLLLS